MDVTPTAAQIQSAFDVALRRNEVNRGARRADGKVLSDSLKIDRQGALGELAVSLALPFPWDGKIFTNEQWLRWRQSGHDLGPLEVRATKHPTGRLIIHPRDPDDSPFVLVRLHRYPTLEIVGWCYGHEGKDRSYWKDVGYGRPCFYVPNQKLKPVEELIRLF